MSVTFAATQHDSDLLGWAIECACGANRTGLLSTDLDAVVDLLDTHTPVCADNDYCNGDRGHVAPCLTERSPEVNLSNFNARFVLDALGITSEDLCGTVDGEEFLGRVLTALAIAPADEGTPSYEDLRPNGGGSMVMCGRAPGYLQDRLVVLHEIAQWATDRGRTVTWA